MTIISHVFATPKTVYLIGLTKSVASYTLYLTALSTETGEELSSAHVPSNISHGLLDLVPLRDLNDLSVTPVIAWLQQGELTSFPLTPDLKQKPTSAKGSAYSQLLDVGLRDHGQFVAIKPDGSSSALKLNKEGPGFKVVWDFADSVRDSISLDRAGLIFGPELIRRHRREHLQLPFTLEASTTKAGHILYARIGLM